MCVPLEEDGKRCYNSSSKGMPINNKHIMAHPPIERNFCDDVHPSIAKLQRSHCYVGLGPLEKIAKTTSFSLHFFLPSCVSCFSELEILKRESERDK